MRQFIKTMVEQENLSNIGCLNDTTKINKEGAFRYQHYLDGCEDAIEYYFQQKKITLYRLVHCPINQNDNEARCFQQYDDFVGTGESVKLDDKPTPDAPLEEKYEYICDLCLSMNVSDKSLADFMLREREKRKKDISKSNFDRKKGTHIVEINITEECGFVDKNIDDNGHVNLLQYEGFDLEKYRNKEYGFRPLTGFAQNETE